MSMVATQGQQTAGHTNAHIDLQGVTEDIFLVLTEKEQEIITCRFSLHNKGVETLESIGQRFSVTRERVRQIQESALKKLRRTLDNTQLQLVVEIAKEIMEKNGGGMSEELLISSVVNYTTGGSIDRSIIKLAFFIDEDILPVKLKKGDELRDAWRLEYVSEKHIRQTLTISKKVLNRESDVVEQQEFFGNIQSELPFEMDLVLIRSILLMSKYFKETEKGWGLMTWRHINPKSIRDKSYIILKKRNEPMHFVEIANAIMEFGFDKKAVTVQAVHNELIRNTMFVLVGRGLYALREWGVQDGTVADVITDILKASGEPMHKQEIIKAVLDRRQVKKGTISLNLQKNPCFVRVGRAVYQYKA